jgi:hypothetical protein
LRGRIAPVLVFFFSFVVCGCASVGGFFIAFFVQARHEFLDYRELEGGCEIWDELVNTYLGNLCDD